MLLALGDAEFDVTHRALVMGVLNRTPDSFYDGGRYLAFDDFLARADAMVADGADLLDIGGVKAGPGEPIDEQEELERVVPAVEALRVRFDLPLSVGTWRSGVLEAALEAGACVANDISGFADGSYLDIAARHGASVVATHIRLAPRVADPVPEYPGGVVEAVVAGCAELARRAEAAGIPRERIMVDAGLDLGKTEPMSLELLRASDELAGLGYPVLLSASNKRFLGEMLGLDVADRRLASVAAHAQGIALGCRILRVHDVKGSRRVADLMGAILAARAPASAAAASPRRSGSASED
jgi:dihydropteroate synthase